MGLNLPQTQNHNVKQPALHLLNSVQSTFPKAKERVKERIRQKATTLSW